MATGFRIRTHADSGNARIASAAGSLITVLDDLLTGGASPWTKTTNGTNDVTYQAPAGSQLKVRVYNTVAHTTSFIVRVTGQIGSDPVFPTATQEATSSQGYVCIKARNSTSAVAANDPGYIGIRTDRWFCLITTDTSTPAAVGNYFAAGDVPTFDGADPGLCILSGYMSTNLTVTGTTVNNTPTGNLGVIDNPATIPVIGYASVASNGTTTSVPLFMYQTLPATGFASLATCFSKMLLGRILLCTTLSTTATSLGLNVGVMRGYFPHIFVFPPSSGWASMDTFTDGNGNSYTIVSPHNGVSVAMMTNDGESGLP